MIKSLVPKGKADPARRIQALAVGLLALCALAALGGTYAFACPVEVFVPPTDTSGSGNDAAPNLHSCYETSYPVNCATGNQSEEQTDLALGGRGPGLHVTRTYNSRLLPKPNRVAPGAMAGRGPTAPTSNSTKNRGR